MNLAKATLESPNPLVRLSSSGRVLLVNPAARQAFGDLNLHSGQPAPETLLKFLGAEVRRSHNSQFIYRGRTYLLETFLSPEGDYSNLYFRDITSQRRAEEEVRRSEARFRLLFEKAPDGVYLHDFNGMFLDGNRAAELLVGYEREELIGHNLFELNLIVPEDLGKVRRSLEDLADERPVPPMEISFIRKDGRRATVESRIHTFELDGVNMVLGIARDITERVAAEMAVRESKLRYKSLFQAADAAILLLREGRIMEVNRRATEYFALSPADLLGRTLVDLSPEHQPSGEQSRDLLESHLRKTITSDTVRFEWTHQRSDDSQFHADVSLDRIDLPGQSFVQVFIHDITRRLETEVEIRQLNRALTILSEINQTIVRQTSEQELLDAICRIIVDLGTFPYCWIGYENSVTRSLERCSSASIQAEDPPHDLDVYLGQLAPEHPVAQAFSTGDVVLTEDLEEQTHLGGWSSLAAQAGWHAALTLPLTLDENRKGALVVFASVDWVLRSKEKDLFCEIAQDIGYAVNVIRTRAARKEAEAQLRLQSSALQAAANAILILDKFAEVVWVNPAFEELTGYRSDEIVGRNIRINRSADEDTEFYDNMWRTITEGRIWSGTVTARRKDGSEYPEERTITPIFDEDGEITHFIAIKQDLTERNKLQQQLLKAQRLEGIGLLASGIAHDLNNVLSPILMGTQILADSMASPADKKLLQLIEVSARHGADVVRQVLTFARGAKGERVPLNLVYLLKEMVKITKSTFPRNIKVDLDFDEDIWSVMGDATQLHQLLLNLCVNARDAMPEGGHLELAAINEQVDESYAEMTPKAAPGHYVRLSVADEGAGIPDDVRAKIFEPFFTTKDPGKGTGLGLASVLGITEGHGGFLKLESSPGRGTRFDIYLPATPNVRAESDTTSIKKAPLGNGELVMIVDDEEAVRKTIDRAVTRQGYRTVIAEDGAEAIANFFQTPGIDVVVTDLVMPVMDGAAFIRALRKSARDIQIVLTTGLADDAATQRKIQDLRQYGGLTLLKKPFSSHDLLNAVHQAIKMKGDSPSTN